MRIGRSRYGHLNPDGTPKDTYINLVLLVIIVVLSPVGLIPFYLAAASMGGVAPTVMVLINLAIFVLGAVAIKRRWDRLRQNAGYSDGSNRRKGPWSGPQQEEGPWG